MVFGQPEENCILRKTCPFLLAYQDIRFCVSEVLGPGCQMEKLRALPEGRRNKVGRQPGRLRGLTLAPQLPGFG